MIFSHKETPPSLNIRYGSNFI